MYNFSKAARLRFARSLTSLNRQQFCQKHQIIYATLSIWENKKIKHGNSLTPKGAEIIITALRMHNIICSLDWLLYNIGHAPSQNVLLEANKTHKPFSCLQQARLAINWAYWQIPNDQMAPRFKAKSYLFYEEIKAPSIKDNHAYLLEDYNGNLHFGFVTRNSKGQIIVYNNDPIKTRAINPKRYFIPKAVCI